MLATFQTTVTINQTVSGQSSSTVENWVLLAATAMLGDLPSQFDHVMLLLPPGTNFHGAAAYGYINYWRTVYQDNYYWMLMVQMHEFGHNLDLAHSGENGNPYGDWTGKFASLKTTSCPSGSSFI